MRTRSWGSDGNRVYLPGYEHRTDTGETKVYIGDYAVISTIGATRKVEYLLKDRLGSVDAVANASGSVIETRGYDAFGKPRSGTWNDLTPAKLQSTAVTPKGFTQHEHLNQLELIHMNGRMYDYNLGRFTGVDPFIQFPLNSQSLNPYSYILNNPLSGTDPTGYAAATGSHINGSEIDDTGARISYQAAPQEQKIGQGKSSGKDNGGKTTAGTTGPGERDSETPGPDKKATEPKTDPNQPSAPTTDDPSNLTRFLGGLKVVGGVLECSAGTLLCGSGVGCAATVLICGHAADTMSSGAHEVWNGVPQQSLTSRGLQAAGLSREQADFGDAVIGLANVGAAGAKATGTVATIRGATAGASAVDSLPGAARAIIDPRKVTEYALNPAHLEGRHKARVFESALGFTQRNADELIAQLRSGVANNPFTPGKIDRFGTRFTVDIPMTGPGGSATVRTGWIYKTGSDTPELATLFVRRDVK